MNPENLGNSPDSSTNIFIKRKRGRPRKDRSQISGGVGNVLAIRDQNGEHADVPPGFVRSNGSCPHEGNAADHNDDALVGQMVTGVIEATFDEGYLISVTVGNSKTSLRGVVYKHGHFMPISTENDVAPHIQMIRRNAVPSPAGYHTPVHGSYRGGRGRGRTRSESRVAYSANGSTGDQLAAYSEKPLQVVPVQPSPLAGVPVLLQPLANPLNVVAPVVETPPAASQPSHLTASKPRRINQTETTQMVEKALKTKNSSLTKQAHEIDGSAVKLPGYVMEEGLNEVSKRIQVSSQPIKTENGSTTNSYDEIPLTVVMEEVKKEVQKKRKVVNQSDDSDDVIEVKEEQESKLQSKTVLSYKGRVTYFRMDSRTHPYTLVESFESLNDSQKKSIEELGFGSLLHLHMKNLPLYLSYWLVENFDADRVALTTASGDTIFIEDVDVAITMGLPQGPIPMPFDSTFSTRNNESLALWKKSIVSGSKRIFAADVVKKMLASKDGGKSFKICFVMLVISSLIESNSNGTVNFSYFNIAENVENIKDINWCGFLLDRLVEAKKSWSHNKCSIFAGSVPFLVLFYVDRIRLQRQEKPRSVPTLANWTNASIKAREADEMKGSGFGYGRVMPRLELHPISQQGSISDQLILKEPVIRGLIEGYTKKAYEDDQPIRDEQISEHAQLFEGLTKKSLKERYKAGMCLLAKSISNIVELTIELVSEKHDDPELNYLNHAAKRIVGHASSSLESISTPDEFANNREIDRLMCLVDVAIAKKEELDYAWVTHHGVSVSRHLIKK